MHVNDLHSHFRLNGKSFASFKDLLAYANDLDQDIFWFLTDWFDDLDFIVTSTSGSVGKPKSIKIKKVHMINSALNTGAYFDLHSKTKALLCLSTNFIAGKMMLVRSMILGWHMDVVEVCGSPLKNISKEYDFSAMAPLQLYHSLDKIEMIKLLLVGGGAVSRKLKDRIAQVSTIIYETFGMTETVTHIAVKKLNHHSNIKRNSNTETLYQVLPGIEILTDTNGCLVIDAPKLSDNVIVTNDLVKIYEDSQFEWIGRVDNIINSGGIKLFPEKIEKELDNFINSPFFISSIHDSILGEKLILIIEGINSEFQEIEIKQSLEKLKTLNKFEIPKEIFFIEKFKTTATGKIQRSETKKLVFS